jgi:HlyD family secretion protein
MLLETNSHSNQDDLAGITGGKILILGDNPATALLIKQTFHAELVTPGSAVGGSFDQEVTQFYSIGSVTFNLPSNSLDRQQAIKHRQSDVDRMLGFWQEKDALARSTSFLKMLCESFGFSEVRNIPPDFLVCLTGTNLQTLSQAWDRLFRFDRHDDAVISSDLSEFHTPILQRHQISAIETQEMFEAPILSGYSDKPEYSTSIQPMNNVSALSGYHSTSLQLTSALASNRRGGWNWRWLSVVGVLGLAGLGALWYTLSKSVMPPPSKAAASAAVVAKQPKLIAAMGYIEPQDETILLSAPAFMEGSRIDKLLVRQGDLIHPGKIVAVLDNRDRLQAILAQTQQSVKIAQAKLEQVKAGSKKGDIRAQEAKYRSSQAELQGQMNTQKSTIGNLQAQLVGERSTQESLILQTKAELNHAIEECNRYTELQAGGAISKSQRDNVCLNRATIQERLVQSNTSLSRIVNTRQQQINEAKSNLQRAIDTLNNDIAASAATRDAISEVRPVDVQVATQEVVSSQAAVNKAKADLAQAYVRSPIKGRVLKINTWPGELIHQQKGIAELGNTSQMYVSAEVYETDIARVRQGQQAKIRADKTIGTLTGTVERVGLKIGTPNTLGTDPVKDADVRVVQVKIRLDPADSKKVSSLTNLQVNVAIDTGV